MKKLILLLTIVPLVLASAVRAEEQINYVIKVTPTLAYLDVGEAVGAMEGATYIIMREDDDDWVVVGEVQLVRVDEHFSIGEIVDMIDSESIEVLQRAVPLSEWEALVAKDARPDMRSSSARRSFHLMGGADRGRNAELTFVPFNGTFRLSEARSGTGLALGVRLGQAIADQWRLNLTYRVGKGQDVTQLAIEGDLHLVPRGYDRAGIYLGAGFGIHQLSWDPPAPVDGSANKAGFNLVTGIQSPNTLNLLFEVGYQKVVRFDNILDISNLRAYLGFGCLF